MKVKEKKIILLNLDKKKGEKRMDHKIVGKITESEIDALVFNFGGSDSDKMMEIVRKNERTKLQAGLGFLVLGGLVLGLAFFLINFDLSDFGIFLMIFGIFFIPASIGLLLTRKFEKKSLIRVYGNPRDPSWPSRNLDDLIKEFLSDKWNLKHIQIYLKQQFGDKILSKYSDLDEKNSEQMLEIIRNIYDTHLYLRIQYSENRSPYRFSLKYTALKFAMIFPALIYKRWLKYLMPPDSALKLYIVTSTPEVEYPLKLDCALLKSEIEDDVQFAVIFASAFRESVIALKGIPGLDIPKKTKIHSLIINSDYYNTFERENPQQDRYWEMLKEYADFLKIVLEGIKSSRLEGITIIEGGRLRGIVRHILGTIPKNADNDRIESLAKNRIEKQKLEVPPRPTTMTQPAEYPRKSVLLTKAKTTSPNSKNGLPVPPSDINEVKKSFQGFNENQLIDNVLIPLLSSMGFREIDPFHPFGPGEKGRDIICLDPNNSYIGFIAIKDKLTEATSGSGSIEKVWNQINRAMVYEYRNKHNEVVRLNKVILIAAGGVVKTKNPREYLFRNFEDHFHGKKMEIWDDFDLAQNIIRYNSFEYPRIPEKPEYEPLIRIYDAIKSIINQGPPWQIYCYSKFAICYLLHMVFVQKDQGKNETLLGIFHLFDGFEHEEEDKNRLYIGEPFQRVDFEQVYNSLKPIWRALFRLGDANDRFMAWFDIPLIREIMRDDLFTNPIYNNKYTEDTLTDEELTQILTINSTYNTVIRHRLEDPQWLTRHHLEKASKQEKEDYLGKDIEDFRQKIPETVAMDMFKLSLKFCREYLRKYNW